MGMTTKTATNGANFRVRPQGRFFLDTILWGIRLGGRPKAHAAPCLREKK